MPNVQAAESGVPDPIQGRMRQSGARSRAGRRAGALSLVGALALAGCGASEPPQGAPVPEPTEPLRPPAQRGTVPEDARVVDYAITASYDEDRHQIDGRVRIAWRNRGPAAVRSMPLHLYMNGFRSPDTAWMQQARGEHRGERLDPTDPWGYIEVTAVERLGGEGSDGTPGRTPLEHAEAADPSLMTVWLDRPAAPGELVELEIPFTTKLPRVFARTGFSDRYVMAGQWFPKPGVLEPDGTWKAHVFTVYSEFYADFGNYEVELDLPGDLVAGASGILVSREVEGARQRLRWRAEMVHDFAWTAGPDLVEAWDDYEGIRIRALVPRERAEEAVLHIEAQRAALASMEARFGPYPWSTITIVDPPEGAEGAGGMEYPTFYTTSPVRPLPRIARALGFDQRFGTFTTIHEFGHQYFQGLLASDEFTQPWLDEGLNSYANLLVYADWYGDDAGDGPWIATVAGHPLALYDASRLQQGESWSIEPIDQDAASFSTLTGGYGPATYGKTAAMMHTLRRLVGPEAFDAAMRAYADRFRFRHPTSDDLIATLTEVLGERVVLGHTESGSPIELSLPAYFEQALRTTRDMDFRVHKLFNQPVLGPVGWRRDEHGTLVGGEPPPERPAEGWRDEDLEGIVVVLRRGGFVVPVEIEVEFSDDTRERVLWDGTGKHRVLRWPGKRVRWASIDPDAKLVLEGRRFDNVRYAEGQRPPAAVSTTVGHLGEAAALAIGGGLGP